jgi:hypothetical protein
MAIAVRTGVLFALMLPAGCADRSPPPEKPGVHVDVEEDGAAANPDVDVKIDGPRRVDVKVDRGVDVKID